VTFSFLSRRILASDIRYVGRHPSDYAEELQETIKWLISQVTGGIPGGFKGTTPLTVTVDGAADAGNESAGWMAADAGLIVASDVPVDLGTANALGSASTASKSDHVHRRTVHVLDEIGGDEIAEQLMFIDDGLLDVFVQPAKAGDQAQVVIRAGSVAPDNETMILANQIFGRR
jgi:hypothetical protein